MMLINAIIKKYESKPKKIFLIDGFGAILSAILLGVVLVRLERYFGIPSSTLYFLATFPVFFALYDFYCYRKENVEFGPFLKGIALINLLYCCLSIGFSFYHIDVITRLGWAYIVIEVLIVMILASLELKVAQKLTRKYGEKRK